MANETQRKTFLSYSRINKDFAVKLAKELKSEGFHIWLDQLDIPPGARWDVEVEKALKESEIFMIIITPASAKSENVLDEIGLAIDSGKRILPVLLETADLPLRLRRLQYVDFTSKSFNEGIESAIELLRNLITEPTIPPGKVLVETQSPAESEKEETSPIAMSIGMTARSVSTASSQKKPPARELVIGLIAVVVLGIAGIGYGALSKNRNVTPSADNPATTPTTEISAMAPSASVQPSATLTLVQPTATLPLSNTPESTISSVPIDPDAAIQTVFIQSALEGDMRGEAGVKIEHPLAFNRDSLVFITPNFEGPDSEGVYNDYPICAYFTRSQWVILNIKHDMKMATMPFGAAFNVQILSAGSNAFIHTATAENTPPGEYWTVLNSKEYPLASDPDALVFATFNLSASAGRGAYFNNPIGVLYKDGQWAIYNRDLADMPEGAAFNVQIVTPGTNAFVHTAAPSNIRGINQTAIDNLLNPLLSDPKMLLFAMPRSSVGSTPIKTDINIGVWRKGGQWTIFNQFEEDENEPKPPMPEGAEFNILILEQSE